MNMAADYEGSPLTTCPVCLEDLYDINRSPVDQKIPRALHCLHTMCEECLHRLAHQTQYRDIRCPQCRQLTPLTKGVSGLPVNYYIRGLQEMSIAKSTQGPVEAKKQELVKCTTCAYGGKTEVAATKCKECELNLCPGCQEKHNECQLFRGHTLHAIGSSRCGTHDKEIEYVCKSCRMELCSVCLLTGNHGSHLDRVISCSRINEEAGVQNQFVGVRLEQVNRDVQKAHDMEKNLLDIRRVVQEWQNDLQDQINSHVDEIVRTLHMKLLSCNYQKLMHEQNTLRSQMERYQHLHKQEGLGATLKRHLWAEEVKEELSRPDQAHWQPVEDIPVLSIEQRQVPWPTMFTKKRPVEDTSSCSPGETTATCNSSGNEIPWPLLKKDTTPKKIKVDQG